MTSVKTVDWKDGAVVLIDQRKLPLVEEYLVLTDYEDVAEAIRNLSVRGAPALGVTVALGIAVGVKTFEGDDREAFLRLFQQLCECMAATRPTAVNTFWAVNVMKQLVESMQDRPPEAIRDAIIEKARNMVTQDGEINRTLGQHGKEVIPDPGAVLTHCNAGGLACAAYGTALGVIRAAAESGKKIRVYADETRPVLQGARLTAWEMVKEGIPVTVITDNAAGYAMQQGKIDVVIVGADRIAANGDVANKIGTYTVAVLAKENGVPFYVAAPLSTYDASIPDGSRIPIEQRGPSEVTEFAGVRTCPEGVEVFNPAFDVTPARLIAGIITEKGIVRPPFEAGFSKLRA